MADKKQTEELPKLPKGYRLESRSWGGWRLIYGEHEQVADICEYEPTRKKSKLPLFRIGSFGDEHVFEQSQYTSLDLEFTDFRSACRGAVRMHEIIMGRQIHPDAASCLRQRVVDLEKEYTEATNRVRTLQWERRDLARIAKKVGVLAPDLPMDWHIIADLKELLGSNNDALFKALGKTSYRDLKSYIRCLLEEVDPVAAATFEEL